MNDLDDDVIKLYYYGDKMGEFCLYDDDGESFNYQKGIYNKKETIYGNT